MSDDKKKQAMSLLFGDVPPRPVSPSSAAAEEEVGGPAATHPEANSEKSQGRKGRGEGRLSNPGPAREASRVEGGAERPLETPDPYYKGSSRYRRKTGDLVKHSVYLDPAVSQAIKIAAAVGDDPRGSNISAIVNAALRELGYK